MITLFVLAGFLPILFAASCTTPSRFQSSLSAQMFTMRFGTFGLVPKIGLQLQPTMACTVTEYIQYFGVRFIDVPESMLFDTTKKELSPEFRQALESINNYLKISKDLFYVKVGTPSSESLQLIEDQIFNSRGSAFSRFVPLDRDSIEATLSQNGTENELILQGYNFVLLHSAIQDPPSLRFAVGPPIYNADSLPNDLFSNSTLLNVNNLEGDCSLFNQHFANNNFGFIYANSDANESSLRRAADCQLTILYQEPENSLSNIISNYIYISLNAKIENVTDGCFFIEKNEHFGGASLLIIQYSQNCEINGEGRRVLCRSHNTLRTLYLSSNVATFSGQGCPGGEPSFPYTRDEAEKVLHLLQADAIGNKTGAWINLSARKQQGNLIVSWEVANPWGTFLLFSKVILVSGAIVLIVGYIACRKLRGKSYHALEHEKNKEKQKEAEMREVKLEFDDSEMERTG